MSDAMRRTLIAVLLALPVMLPVAAAGDEAREPRAASPESPEPAGGTPALDLDRLLRVPGGITLPQADERGGKAREDWTREFEEARAEIEELEARIERSQQNLRTIAPEDWGFTPAGGGAPSDPEVLRLRAELRRDRQSLEAARQRMRDLEVEASLAGVPDAWRAPPGP